MSNELGAILYAAVSLCIVAVALLNARTSRYRSEIDGLRYKVSDLKERVERLQDVMDRLVTGDDWEDVNDNPEDES